MDTNYFQFSVISFQRLQEITYSNLLAGVKASFTLAPNEIAERFKFQKQPRKPGKSIVEFFNSLRRLSEFCDFSETSEHRL